MIPSLCNSINSTKTEGFFCLCFCNNLSYLKQVRRRYRPIENNSGIICNFVSIYAKSLQSRPTLQPCGLQPSRLLYPWDSPGKNPRVGCHAPLQGIFLTQESNPRFFCLLHWHAGALPLASPGKPIQSGNPEITCP